MFMLNVLSWSSFFALYWLWVFGVLDVNAATLAGFVIFAVLGLASLPRTKPPKTHVSGNGRRR